MQPVNTGRPIVRRHYVYQQTVSHAQSPLRRLWDGDIFLSLNSSRVLLIGRVPLAWQKVGVPVPLGLGGVLGRQRQQLGRRVLQANAQRVLVGELVDEIARIAPREVVRVVEVGVVERVEPLLLGIGLVRGVVGVVGAAAVAARRGG
jgi:hypothetical protein